ncbi:uncharacterized protein LOC110540019 isoform X4 [Meriones unguiculatus]|uniref:uncharacterized protein LOC110540019 isoform X4 n=1 Tax=Meriones unguiculatus TaxID=10047 RepID=UPI00293F5816|nr:uncharacterized protein LOC110540019 isoform X4 [Meriones unguiculatus]XP_060235577.1 uncharacterized protein LOC110540019 isoform X4 [Meriones unguiculatus]
MAPPLPAAVRVHIHAPGARPPRGEWRGGGTGTAPPPVPVAWAPLSPQRGRLGAGSVPRSTRAGFPAASHWGGGGLRAPGGARAPSRGSAPHSSLRGAAACGPGSRESGLRRERESGVASWLCTAQLLTSAASPPASRCPPLRAVPPVLVFPLLPLRLSVTATWTSPGLKVRPARTQSDPLRLHASRWLSGFLPGHAEARSFPGVSRPSPLAGTVFVTVWFKTKLEDRVAYFIDEAPETEPRQKTNVGTQSGCGSQTLLQCHVCCHAPTMMVMD